jgi:glutamate-1-semialdehyde 2,1-aminomutase
MNIVKQYAEQNRKSLQLYRRAQASLPSGNTRSALYWPPFPLYLHRGSGSTVWDADGNPRVDLNYNNTTLIHGHNHPEVLAAARGQLEHGTVLGAPTEPEVRLAEELTKRIRTDRIRFTPSGTEANMQALRVARAATSRHLIAKCVGAYHGSWDAVPLTAEAPDVPKAVLGNTIQFPYNDAEAAEKTIKEHRGELAAVIVEPTMRDMAPEPGFLEAVREATEDSGVLLVFDEVISFRLGPSGAQGLYGVRPDITTMGKIIGGGFPVGAYAASEETMAPLVIPEAELPATSSPALGFSGTFNAHPVTMAAGLAAMKLLNKASYAKLASMGETIRKGLRGALEEEKVKAHVGGVGSFFHISWTDREVRDHASSLTADRALGTLFNLAVMNRGFYLLGHPNVSTVLGGGEAEGFLEAARGAVKELRPLIAERAPRLIR